MSNKAFALCHASGWCGQSQQKLAEWKDKQQATKDTYYAFRWDGAAYPYSLPVGLSGKNMNYLKETILKENKSIFNMLYKNIQGDYNVPAVFDIQKIPTVQKILVKQGFNETDFLTSVFPKLKGNVIQPGTFTLIYMESCEHLPQYMPMWNCAVQICTDLRTGLYMFEKKIYSKELDKAYGIKINELPVVIFSPSNKALQF